MRHLYSEDHFSYFNDITAEREYLIRREIEEGVVVWCTAEGKELSTQRAVSLEEKYAEEFDEIPVSVKNPTTNP